MAFFTLPFLVFISAVFILYFLAPKKLQWVVLLAASYLYIWLNSEKLLLVHMVTVFVTYGIGHWIYAVNQSGKERIQSGTELTPAEKKSLKAAVKKKAKRILLLGVFLDLGVLLYLKYFNFFASNANILLSRLGVRMPTIRILLPIGISFYTLQALAYMIDIYRGKVVPDKNPGHFMLFMSFFPQIVQGPIARYNQLAHQLTEPHVLDYKRFTFGVQMIMWGFFKKLVIAERIAIPTDYIFSHWKSYTGGMAFIGAVFYGLQVYADFSGGMDIARGVSQILGIELELNFRQPYFSTSIEEFWRRWHITLGGWMRDYIFYPLSLSKLFTNLSKRARKVFGDFIGKRLPSFLAMFIVYFLVGFWHGAEWKYIGYGVWNGVFIVSGILLAEKYEQAKQKLGIRNESVSWKLFQILRTFIICSYGRFFSRAPGFLAAVRMMRATFVHWKDLSFMTDGSLLNIGLDTANWVVLIVALIILFAVDFLHERNIEIREGISRQHIIFRWAIFYAAFFAILIFGIWGPQYDSAKFIYEQF